MMRFLNVPMTFQRDTGVQVRIRRRGVPISHELSSLFGECLMFIMEAAVCQETDALLHRIHDDLWLWGSDQAQVIKAWEVMNNYANLINLKFNIPKSGSAIVISESHASVAPFGPHPLPQDTVRWGSLVLRGDGLLHIDETELQPQVEEMRKKLLSSETVMSWINVYNKYMACFLRNFGSCAKVFGIQHISQIDERLQWIHMQAFKEYNGNTLECLKSRFKVLQSVEILDMWAYWPLSAGGLGMKNVLLEIGASMETLKDVEHFDFNDLPQEDRQKWELQELVKEDDRKRRGMTENNFLLDPENEKLKSQTFEEYCELRERKLRYWAHRYNSLLNVVEPKAPVPLDSSVVAQLNRLSLDNVECARRVISYYNNQLGEAFGSLEFIDMTLIPQSLVETIKRAKIQWD